MDQLEIAKRKKFRQKIKKLLNFYFFQNTFPDRMDSADT